MNSNNKCNKCGRELSLEELKNGCSYCHDNLANYTSIKVISFIFPFYGLLIYSINIGKESKKSEKVANIALEWFIYGIIFTIVLVVIACITYFLVFTPNEDIKEPSYNYTYPYNY